MNEQYQLSEEAKQQIENVMISVMAEAALNITRSMSIITQKTNQQLADGTVLKESEDSQVFPPKGSDEECSMVLSRAAQILRDSGKTFLARELSQVLDSWK